VGGRGRSAFLVVEVTRRPGLDVINVLRIVNDHVGQPWGRFPRRNVIVFAPAWTL
jgi:hypothetical protein